MSHHAGGHVPPFITTVSPTSCTAAGNTTFTFEGTRFSPSMQVEIPESFGTLVSKTITYPTSTTSRCVLVVNVNEPSDTSVTHSIKFYNGGEFAANDSESNVVHTSWTPAALCTGSTDYWWNPDSLSGSKSNGDTITSFPSSEDDSPLTLTEDFTSYLPQYVHNHLWSTVSGSEKRASGIGRPPGPATSATNHFMDTVIPLANGVQSGSGNLEQLTVAFVAKNVSDTGLSAGSKYPLQFRLGNDNKRITYKANDGWFIDGMDWYQVRDFNNAGSIVQVIGTWDGGASRLRVPALGIDVSATYTPAPAPSDVSALYFSYQRNPVIYGEYLILNRKISESEITELRSYWDQKYGASS